LRAAEATRTLEVAVGVAIGAVDHDLLDVDGRGPGKGEAADGSQGEPQHGCAFQQSIETMNGGRSLQFLNGAGQGLSLTRFRRPQASTCLRTSVALVPPNPKELERTCPSLAPSRRWRRIGMSAKAGSISSIWALSQMKSLFIISRE
jgi:hypothetical protein